MRNRYRRDQGFAAHPSYPSLCSSCDPLTPRRSPAATGRYTALLSSLSDAREQDEEEEEEFYEEGDEQQEYDDEEEEQEYDEEDDELVEVGYVSGAHGVRGDVLVTPRTDFPELRFATVTHV